MSGDRAELLFVYGTLLAGEASHQLLEGAELVGVVRTAPRFSLVDLGTYPGLVRGGDVSVLGELWALDIATLARIDVHEGHPVLFKRAPIVLEDGREVEAYLLELDQTRGRRRIRSGSWRDRAVKVVPEGASARDGAFVRWSRGR